MERTNPENTTTTSMVAHGNSMAPLIIHTVRARGGTIDENSVSNAGMSTLISFTCKNQHSCKILASNIREWCSICKILDKLTKTDPAIKCVNNSVDNGQVKFEFVCKLGHRFIVSIDDVTKSRPLTGCKSCVILEQGRKKHNVDLALTLDCMGLYAHEQSRLRFHCNKVRHDPNCTNEKCVLIMSNQNSSNSEYDSSCTNMVPCNQDFYATPKQLKFGTEVLNCKMNHRWFKEREMFSAIRVFEIFFGDRFDDDTRIFNIEFTGYNKSLKLAYTHGNDIIANKCRLHAASWCETNNVKFIYIPSDIRRAGAICTFIVNKLSLFGLIEESVDLVVQKIRTTMHEMDRKNKLFEDRCVTA